MDPLSIASGAAGLTGVCIKVRSTLRLNIIQRTLNLRPWVKEPLTLIIIISHDLCTFHTTWLITSLSPTLRQIIRKQDARAKS